MIVKPARAPHPPRIPKHYALISNRRRQIYMCPTCGVLGDLSAVAAHTVRFQPDMTKEGSWNGG